MCQREKNTSGGVFYLPAHRTAADSLRMAPFQGHSPIASEGPSHEKYQIYFTACHDMLVAHSQARLLHRLRCRLDRVNDCYSCRGNACTRTKYTCHPHIIQELVVLLWDHATHHNLYVPHPGRTQLFEHKRDKSFVSGRLR